jgi:hypothetical protein
MLQYYEIEIRGHSVSHKCSRLHFTTDTVEDRFGSGPFS